eukprot:g31228.t1
MDFEKQVKPAWLLYVESIDVDDVPDVPDVPEEEETPEPPMPKGSSKKKPGKPKSKKPAVDADEVDMSLELKAKKSYFDDCFVFSFLGHSHCRIHPDRADKQVFCLLAVTVQPNISETSSALPHLSGPVLADANGEEGTDSDPATGTDIPTFTNRTDVEAYPLKDSFLSSSPEGEQSRDVEAYPLKDSFLSSSPEGEQSIVQ